MSKAIGLIALTVIGAAGYFLAWQTQYSEEQSAESDTELKQNLSGTHSDIEPNQRLAGTLPDSNVSRCSALSTSDDKILTRFAGLVLEYPCTAMHRGSWMVLLDQDGQVLEQDYTLSVRLDINESENTIWPPQRAGQIDRSAFATRIALISNGTAFPTNHFHELFKNADQLAELATEDLVLFSNPPFLYAAIRSELESTGRYVFLQCSWRGDSDPLTYFASERNRESRSSCSASWILGERIRVRWQSFDSSKGHTKLLFSDRFE